VSELLQVEHEVWLELTEGRRAPGAARPGDVLGAGRGVAANEGAPRPRPADPPRGAARHPEEERQVDDERRARAVPARRRRRARRRGLLDGVDARAGADRVPAGEGDGREVAEAARPPASSSATIELRKDGSFYKVVAADAGAQEGINPHGVMNDEIHAHKTRELYDTLRSATIGARPADPLLDHDRRLRPRDDRRRAVRQRGAGKPEYTRVVDGQVASQRNDKQRSFYFRWYQADPKKGARGRRREPRRGQAANPASWITEAKLKEEASQPAARHLPSLPREHLDDASRSTGSGRASGSRCAAPRRRDLLAGPARRRGGDPARRPVVITSTSGSCTTRARSCGRGRRGSEARRPRGSDRDPRARGRRAAGGGAGRVPAVRTSPC
jgi:hypothetical protein